MDKFKNLPTKTKRAIIVGTVVAAPIIGTILGADKSDPDAPIIFTFIFGIPLYWIGVFTLLWINQDK